MNAQGLSPSGAPSGAARHTLVIATLSFSAFLTAMTTRITDGMVTVIGDEFALDWTTATAAISAFAIVHGIAQLLMGPLGEVFGKLRMITTGCAGAAAASLVCALAPSFDGLLSGRALAGIATAPLIPLAMAWIGDVVPYAQRQPVLARFILGQILGLSTGIWLGGLVADHFAWRQPFWFIALGYLLATVVLGLQQRRLAAARAAEHGPEARPGWRQVPIGLKRTLASSWARKVLLTAYLEGALLFGVLAFVGIYLSQRHGIGLATASATVMPFGLGGIVYVLVSRRLLGRLGEYRLVLLGGALMASAMLALAFSAQWQWALPACFCCGLGFYMMHNTLQTKATQMNPEHRSAAMSVYASCFFFGQASGVAAMGWAAQALGMAPTMVLAAVLMVGLALAFGRGCRRH